MSSDKKPKSSDGMSESLTPRPNFRSFSFRGGRRQMGVLPSLSNRPTTVNISLPVDKYKMVEISKKW
jgi:hypothetical protein